MKTNTKPVDYRKDTGAKVAGGFGVYAAKQNAEALLRRAVMGCLLWEDLAYESGVENANNIANLIPQVNPNVVAQIAVDARYKQKLRHVPLFIVREMAKLDTHKPLVADTLQEVINRPDEITEFVSLYWKDGKQPLSNQVKRGLAKAFNKFDAYQLAKYNRNTVIKLRDVMFMVHPKPQNAQQALDFTQLANDTLPTPDTWEVELSQSSDKKASWKRLLKEKKLGALAFIRNLRNMNDANVAPSLVRDYFKTVNPTWLLPINFITAAKYVPKYMREIEQLMLSCLAKQQKLTGHTVFIVDVSGSMQNQISGKSESSRLGVATAMTIMAASICESISLYATAGNDYARTHATKILNPYQGFALQNEINSAYAQLGGGGIFTRQCLEYIATQEKEVPERIIVFSDSQDCDYPNSRVPKPFGKYNYIVDVSANSRGINYDGVWTAEISGWSESFLSYIAAYEGLEVEETLQD